MISAGDVLFDEDNKKYTIVGPLWRATDAAAFLATDGAVIVVYEGVPEGLRGRFRARFRLLAQRDGAWPVLAPAAVLDDPFTGYVAVPHRPFRLLSSYLWLAGRTEAAAEAAEETFYDEGGIGARYEIAISLLVRLETLHRAGRLAGPLRLCAEAPGDVDATMIGVEEGTHHVIFLRVDPLARLGALRGRPEPRSSLAENADVLPFLRALLVPPEDAEEEARCLPDDLRALLSPEGGDKFVTLAPLVSACRRALHALAYCPGCEMWYFAQMGEDQACPWCGCRSEAPCGARLYADIEAQGAMAELLAGDAAVALGLPVQERFFTEGVQRLDARAFLGEAFPWDKASPLVAVDVHEDGALWLANLTDAPLTHHCGGEESALAPEASACMTRGASRITFPPVPMEDDGVVAANVCFSMEFF